MSWKRSKPESPLSACRDKCFMHRFLDVHEGFELSVIAERSNNLARGAYPGVQVVRSFDDLLATDIELVVVNTPDRLMPIIAGQPDRSGRTRHSGKTVRTHLCRSTSIDPVGRGKSAAADGFSKPTLRRGFLTVKQILQSGELGRIVEFQSAFQRYRPDMAAARAPWREEPLPGNGITYDLCSHLSDQALALFGRPDGVWATLASQRDGSRVDDYSLGSSCFTRT